MMKKLFFTLLCVGVLLPTLKAELPTYIRVCALGEGGVEDYEGSAPTIPIYQEPDTTAAVVAQLELSLLGWAPAKLLWRAYTWAKVQQGEVMGYVQCSKMQLQTWYYGEGPWVIVSESENTPIYTIYTETEEELDWSTASEVIDYVHRGTILADCSGKNPFDENGYYILNSCLGQYYFIKKEDVKIIHRTQVPN